MFGLVSLFSGSYATTFGAAAPCVQEFASRRKEQNPSLTSMSRNNGETWDTPTDGSLADACDLKGYVVGPTTVFG